MKVLSVIALALCLNGCAFMVVSAIVQVGVPLVGMAIGEIVDAIAEGGQATRPGPDPAGGGERERDGDE